MSAVPTGLEPLRDDGVDATRLEPERFVYGGGRRENLRTAAAHPREQFGRRQSEMEAHHRRPEFFEDVNGLRRKRAALRRGTSRVRVDAKLVIIRRQRLAPALGAP